MVSFLNNLTPNVRADNGLVSERPSDTATIFSQGLKRGLGVDVKPSPENDPGNKVFDVQKVVDTVSGFIEQRIAERRNEGASQTELENLIAQAREGVAKGFQLAREDIASLDRLDPELSSNIDAAEQGIGTRIDQIEESLKPADEGVLTSLSSNSFAALTDRKSFERSQASFQFELTTQEGDRIQISAQELFQRREQFSAVQSNGVSASRFSSDTTTASAFSIQVNGDLNEDERAALDDLLQQVADLSDSFFEGDIASAFNQALSLEFDSSQIAQFSVDLKSSSVSVIEQTDVRASQFNSLVPDEYRAPQLPLGIQTLLSDYAERVEKLLETAQQFSEKVGLEQTGESLLKDLQQRFDTSVGRDNSQSEFFDALLDKLS